MPVFSRTHGDKDGAVIEKKFYEKFIGGKMDEVMDRGKKGRWVVEWPHRGPYEESLLRAVVAPVTTRGRCRPDTSYSPIAF